MLDRPDKRPCDLAFSKTAREIQTRKGSRHIYEAMETKPNWTGVMSRGVKEFVAGQRSVYLGTVSDDGQPYIQHRGGPEGFLKILSDTAIGFADLKGNQQFISQANLLDNDKAFMFLMDYTNLRRLKLWGTAKVIEDDDDLIASLMPENYDAEPEQAIIFEVGLWSLNCRAHIPQRFEAGDVEHEIATRDARIAELEAKLAELKNQPYPY